MRRRTIALAAVALSSSVAAQTRPGCTPYRGDDTSGTGSMQIMRDAQFQIPGAGDQFGVTGYSCASCQMKHDKGKLPEFTFFTEPVVTAVGTPPGVPIYYVDGERVDAETAVKPGDVIEAVNGQPITTAAGANEFFRPAAGPATLTVRRGRDRVVLKFQIPGPPCPDWSKRGGSPPPVWTSPFALKESIFAARDRDSIRVLTDSLRAILDRLASMQRVDAPSRTTRYGFALWCVSQCAIAQSSDHVAYYTYADPPLVSAIRDGSAASAAGLKVGDLIVKVDGRSILEDGAALALVRAEQRSSLSMIVLRDGKEVGVVLTAPK